MINIQTYSGISFQIFSLKGPYHEGSEVVLVCEAGGGKPTPQVIIMVMMMMILMTMAMMMMLMMMMTAMRWDGGSP